MSLSKITKFAMIHASLWLFSLKATGANDLLPKPTNPLQSLVGDTELLATKRGDLVIYQFWASWCAGCGQVMPQIAKILEGKPQVSYVSISIDENKDLALKFFANKPEAAKFALPKSYLDSSGKNFAEPSGVDSLPYLIVTDKNGTVIKRFKGHPNQQELEKLIGKGA